MNKVTTEISKAEYLRYKSNPAAYRREREGLIPDAWVRGYGWYGCFCHESHGHYFRVDSIGNSCD